MPPNFQNIIKSRQPDLFVGRQASLDEFRRNLDRPANDPNRYFVINISGQAGVGKTKLIDKFRKHSQEAGLLTAYTNEEQADVVAVMERIAAQLNDGRRCFREF